MTAIRKSFRANPITFILAVLALAMSLSIGAYAAAVRPTNSSVNSNLEMFKHSSRFAALFVIDRPMIYIPVAPVQIITTDGLASVATGAGTYVETGTSESVSVYVDTDNDTVPSGIVALPVDIDLAQDIQCRVIWHQSEAAATGTINWTLTYEIYKGGTSAIVVPNDAFDTDGGAQVDLAADVITLGPWSTITGGTITAVSGDSFFALLAKYTESTAANAELDGFQCRYYRKWLGGGQG
jgi:hypothetical protein